MRLARSRDDYQLDSMLPLINIVFLLLIFFMLAGALHAVDIFQLDPPSSKSETHATPEESTILLDARGRIAIGSEIMDDVDLQLVVTDRLAQDRNAVFRLKADAKTEASRVVQVMELLEAVGVRRITILTLEAAP